MNSEKFKKILEITEELVKDSENSKGKLEKTIKMKPEWTRMWDEVGELADEAQALVHKLETKRRLMWSTIENDIEIYDKQLTIVPERGVLEVYNQNDKSDN